MSLVPGHLFVSPYWNDPVANRIRQRGLTPSEVEFAKLYADIRQLTPGKLADRVVFTILEAPFSNLHRWHFIARSAMPRAASSQFFAPHYSPLTEAYLRARNKPLQPQGLSRQA